MPSPIHLSLTLLCLLAQLSSGQYLRGVNLAGAEFGDTKIPGKINTDYTYNSERSFGSRPKSVMADHSCPN
jgi:hypothetical protein